MAVFFWLKKRAYKLDSNNSSRVNGHVLYVNLSLPTHLHFVWILLLMSLVYGSLNIKRLSKPQISAQFFSFFLGSGIAHVSSQYATEPSTFPNPISHKTTHQLRPNLGEFHRFIWRISQALHPRGRKEFDEVHFFFGGVGGWCRDDLILCSFERFKTCLQLGEHSGELILLRILQKNQTIHIYGRFAWFAIDSALFSLVILAIVQN